MTSSSQAQSNLAPKGIGIRVQNMDLLDQALALARLAESREIDHQFTGKDLEKLFIQMALPFDTQAGNVIVALEKRAFVRKGSARGRWKLTPNGRHRSLETLSETNLASLVAESTMNGSILGHVAHAVVPPMLAPPAVSPRLLAFLEEFPFETNVFGMTRFPDKNSASSDSDPVEPALEVTRDICRMHGLAFHLAADRNIHDDLWANVAAHMWACQYGIAFFEDRRKKGMNYNLTIEVGGMLMTGRRCALLKDTSSPAMPTDLVGQIYKSVDLGNTHIVAVAVHQWLSKDLGLGPCPACSKPQ